LGADVDTQLQGGAEVETAYVQCTGEPGYAHPLQGLPRPAEPCALWELCEEFLPNLQVDEFLDRRHDLCFCPKCYPKELPDIAMAGGHKFVIPRGWLRLGVEVMQGKAKANRIWDTWNVAFHGLSIPSLRTSFTHGQMLLPGDKLLDNSRLGVRKGHIPARKFFYSSPTVKYCKLHMYATPSTWTSKDGIKYTVQVALQVRQKPGTYSKQRESVFALRELCKHICNTQIEWYTDNRAAVVVTGILVNMARQA
jgi:hypothetical protein